MSSTDNSLRKRRGESFSCIQECKKSIRDIGIRSSNEMGKSLIEIGSKNWINQEKKNSKNSVVRSNKKGDVMRIFL